MTDIVERLRSFEGSDELGNGDFTVCLKAADEIERLRLEVKALEYNLKSAFERYNP